MNCIKGVPADGALAAHIGSLLKRYPNPPSHANVDDSVRGVVACTFPRYQASAVVFSCSLKRCLPLANPTSIR
jgi:hypothetical protein